MSSEINFLKSPQKDAMQDALVSTRGSLWKKLEWHRQRAAINGAHSYKARAHRPTSLTHLLASRIADPRTPERTKEDKRAKTLNARVETLIFQKLFKFCKIIKIFGSRSKN